MSDELLSLTEKFLKECTEESESTEIKTGSLYRVFRNYLRAQGSSFTHYGKIELMRSALKVRQGLKHRPGKIIGLSVKKQWKY